MFTLQGIQQSSRIFPCEDTAASPSLINRITADEYDEVSKEDYSIADLLNYLSENLDDILINKNKLKKLEEITRNVILSQNDPALNRVVRSHGWSGNRYLRIHHAALDIESYIRSLANLYLSQRNVYSGRQTVTVGETLTESEKVVSFLPDILVKHLTKNVGDISCSRFYGAALLVDISGFSTFAATMCSKGVKGLDELHDATNVFLGNLVLLVYQYGGDVVAFAGDALICVFTDDDEFIPESIDSISPAESNSSILLGGYSLKSNNSKPSVFDFNNVDENVGSAKSPNIISPKSPSIDVNQFSPVDQTPYSPLNSPFLRTSYINLARRSSLKPVKEENEDLDNLSSARPSIRERISVNLLRSGLNQLSTGFGSSPRASFKLKASADGASTPVLPPLTRQQHLDIDPYLKLNCCRRALECSMVLSKQTTSSFSTHCAVSYGEMKLAILGGHNDDWVYLLNGICISDLGPCLNEAKKQQVVVTKACYEMALNVLIDDCQKEGVTFLPRNLTGSYNRAESYGKSSSLFQTTLSPHAVATHKFNIDLTEEKFNNPKDSELSNVDNSLINQNRKYDKCNEISIKSDPGIMKYSNASTTLTSNSAQSTPPPIESYSLLNSIKQSSKRLNNVINESDESEDNFQKASVDNELYGKSNDEFFFNKLEDISTYLDAVEVCNGNFLIKSIKTSLVPNKTKQRLKNIIQSTPANVLDSAKLFVSRPVLSAIYSDTLDRTSELRQVVTMFVELESYSPEEHNDPLTLQPFFLIIQEALLESGGYLRQFVVDDKGCVAIAMWGVPQFSYSCNTIHGLFCGIAINRRAKLAGINTSVGITSGYSYCGTIGGTIRRDYVVIGDQVNMAARFMSKAKGRVLFDSYFKDNLPPDFVKEFHDYFAQVETMTLKGLSEPITPWSYLGPEITLDKDDHGGHATVLRRQVRIMLIAQLNKISNISRIIEYSRQRSVYSLQSRNIPHSQSGHVVTNSTHLSNANSNVNSIHASSTHTVTSTKSAGQLHGMQTGRDPSSLRLKPTIDHQSPGLSDDNAHIRDDSNYDDSQGPQFSHGPSNSFSGNAAVSSVNSTRLPHNREYHAYMTVVLGLPGTGKSTVAQYFEQEAKHREIDCIKIQARSGDNVRPYNIVRKLFLELIGVNKFRDENSQKSIISDLINKAYTNASDEVKLEAELTLEIILGLEWSDVFRIREETTSQTKTSQENLSLYDSASSNTDSLLTSITRISSILSSPMTRSNHGTMNSLIDEDDKLNLPIRRRSSSSSSNVMLSSSVNSAIINSPSTTRNNGIIKSNNGESVYSDSVSGNPGGHNNASFNAINEKKLRIKAGDLTFYNILKAIIQHKKMVIIIEDADYCDELSWNEILLMLKGVDLQLGLLLTMKTVPVSLRMSSSVGTPSNTTNHGNAGTSQPSRIGNTPINQSSVNTNQNNNVESNLNSSMIKVARASGDTLDVSIDEFFSSAPTINDNLHSFTIFPRNNNRFRTNAAYKSILSHPRALVIELNPLTSKEVKELLKDIGDVDEKLIDSVLHVTSGNAFWCKAVAKYIKEFGKAEFEKSIDSNLEYSRHNSSLITLITNKIDKLTTEQQLVAKNAAIIGEEFQLSVLNNILPHRIQTHLSACLEALQQNSLVYCIDETNDDVILSFQNPLIRSVIYNLNPPGERSSIHFSIAHSIQTLYGDDLKPYYPTLSYHYRSSNGKRPQAFLYTAKSADQYLSRGQYGDCYLYLEEARKLASHLMDLYSLLEIVRIALKELDPNNMTSSFFKRFWLPRANSLNELNPTEILVNQFKALDREIKSQIKVKIERANSNAGAADLQPVLNSTRGLRPFFSFSRHTNPSDRSVDVVSPENPAQITRQNYALTNTSENSGMDAVSFANQNDDGNRYNGSVNPSNASIGEQLSYVNNRSNTSDEVTAKFGKCIIS